MKQPLSVLLADDHPVVLQGLVNLLNSFADIRVVAECSDGIDALKSIRRLAPNVAVLDMAMPGLTGLEVLSRIRGSEEETKFVIFTASVSEAEVAAVIANGAKGIVHKDAVLEDLVHCIREVAKGRPWLSPTIAATIAEYQWRSPVQPVHGQLTARERQVMMLVSEGLSNKEVGHKLDVREGTVKIHLHNIFQKTGLANRTALTATVISSGNTDGVPRAGSSDALPLLAA